MNQRLVLAPKSLIAFTTVGVLSLANCKARSGASDNDLKFIAHDKFHEVCEVPSSKEDYNALFCIARNILTRPSAREFHRKHFKDVLNVNKEMADRLKMLFDKDSSQIRDLTEGQYLAILMRNEHMWEPLVKYLSEVARLNGKDPSQAFKDKWTELFKSTLDNLDDLQALNDPLEAFVLIGEDDDFKSKKFSPQYRNLRLTVNHAYLGPDGQVIKPSSDGLKGEWIRFIKSAKKEFAMNIFDFDLMDVADAIVAARKRGVSARVGIDATVSCQKIDSRTGKPKAGCREKVLAVFNELKENGVSVFGVDSPGLNHQKMAAIDWSLKGKGKVLLSSGNLTQSCSGQEGDFEDFSPEIQKHIDRRRSLPNANHLIVFESDFGAALVNSELTKTLDLGLRGTVDSGSTRAYPVSGAFQIFGEVDPKTKEQSSMIMAFTPGGGYKNMNAVFLSQIIQKMDLKKGPMRMAQFAYSSQDVRNSILKKAKDTLKSHASFDFISVGDTPFSVQGWSKFLEMSDMRATTKDDVRESGRTVKVTTGYEPIPDGEWSNVFSSKEKLKQWRDQVRIAPRRFGEFPVKVDGKSLVENGREVKITVKIHHKLIAGGSVSTLGTSFNFSEGAETNNEQMIAIVDQRLADAARGIVNALAEDIEGTNPGPTKSVFCEAARRSLKKGGPLVKEFAVCGSLQSSSSTQAAAQAAVEETEPTDSDDLSGEDGVN
ncbi:MAG: phospholipase D-like domain-containing protein [Proteobacteria bacterium]|nr:phospholipase D-like domain-containing protein [Pseudomonadota bacterium]